MDIGFEFTSYYAGHVLGAAMFFVRVGHQTVLYTGERKRDEIDSLLGFGDCNDMKSSVVSSVYQPTHCAPYSLAPPMIAPPMIAP